MKGRLTGGIAGLLCGCWVMVANAQVSTSASASPPPAEAPALVVPPGFTAEVWAEGVTDARTLRLGDSGTVFVSTRRAGLVHALSDTDGDGRADQHQVLATSLNRPNGIAFRDGDLYVAESQRIWKLEDIESRLKDPPPPVAVRSDLPDYSHHGSRYIDFGPDGKLYVALGAPCNVCDKTLFERDGETLETASITRMNPDGSDWEVVARGVRNSMGFAWRPGSDALWFTDNGRDWLGDDSPDCELNRLDRVGGHFGFPFCHAGEVVDPDLGAGQRCENFIGPEVKLGAHVAALGMRFYDAEAFPEAYRGDALIAEHGSWNRSSKVGYRVTRIDFEKGKVVGREPFMEGWLNEEVSTGRPVDLLVMPDGSLLVSDDQAGRIWRVDYRGA